MDKKGRTVPPTEAPPERGRVGKPDLRRRMFDLAVAELEMAILGTSLTGSLTVQCKEGAVRTIRLGGDDGVVIWQDGVQKMSVLPSVGR